jgi:hypothetical protein
MNSAAIAFRKIDETNEGAANCAELLKALCEIVQRDSLKFTCIPTHALRDALLPTELDESADGIDQASKPDKKIMFHILCVKLFENQSVQALLHLDNTAPASTTASARSMLQARSRLTDVQYV